ncbi:MAG: hypothetical protein Kow0090_16850 [Myxococcota bacterium]
MELTFLPSLFTTFPDYTRRALHYHIPAVILEGFAQGISLLYIIIARKTLLASDLIITLLTMGPLAVMILSNIFALEMFGKSKRPYFIASAIIGRVPLLLIFFIEDASMYAVIILISVFYYVIFKPAENSLIQANYDKSHIGEIYGYLSSIALLSSMFAAFLGGKVLDADPHNYRYIIPAAAILSFIAMMLYAFMPVRKVEYVNSERCKPSVLEAYKNFFTTLFKDKAFRRFEVCFLIYGFGILMLEPLVIILFVNELKLEYSQAAAALGLVSQFVILLFTPFMGRLFDGINAFKMLSLSVAILIFHSLLLYFSYGLALVYAAYVFRGLSMAGITILWNLGPIKFAGEKDSTNYMGIHLTMVGIRGILAPTLGMASYYLIGIRNAFLLSAALLFISATLSFAYYKRENGLAESKVEPIPLYR